MLVALAFIRNQMDNDEYKLVAPLVPLSASKRHHSTPSCHFIPPSSRGQRPFHRYL
ncbi:hypothetical protein DSO57_1027214 [Entomophthora muscae]|uniref:Uncharacterized protein n=1 Tax=Entomophthora muscae TaxID=34485 RepID=A0ACC2UN36_9FUNG|nr:hypothetical protein DSO57_1027214 [Entomophthora muscae]